MKLVLATNNMGKVREFARILEPLGISLLTQQQARRAGAAGGKRHHFCRKRPHQGDGGLSGDRSADDSGRQRAVHRRA